MAAAAAAAGETEEYVPYGWRRAGPRSPSMRPHGGGEVGFIPAPVRQILNDTSICPWGQEEAVDVSPVTGCWEREPNSDGICVECAKTKGRSEYRLISWELHSPIYAHGELPGLHIVRLRGPRTGTCRIIHGPQRVLRACISAIVWTWSIWAGRSAVARREEELRSTSTGGERESVCV